MSTCTQTCCLWQRLAKRRCLSSSKAIRTSSLVYQCKIYPNTHAPHTQTMSVYMRWYSSQPCACHMHLRPCSHQNNLFDKCALTTLHMSAAAFRCPPGPLRSATVDESEARTWSEAESKHDTIRWYIKHPGTCATQMWHVRFHTVSFLHSGAMTPAPLGFNLRTNWITSLIHKITSRTRQHAPYAASEANQRMNKLSNILIFIAYHKYDTLGRASVSLHLRMNNEYMGACYVPWTDARILERHSDPSTRCNRCPPYGRTVTN